MKQDEIIEMADMADDLADAKIQMKGEFHPDWHRVRDEIFAKLVAAKEREACAKTLESISNAPDIKAHAAAIRARGET